MIRTTFGAIPTGTIFTPYMRRPLYRAARTYVKTGTCFYREIGSDNPLQCSAAPEDVVYLEDPTDRPE